MLVNRKQDWAAYQEPERVKTSPARKPRPKPGFRKNFLQLLFLMAAVAMLVTVHSESIVRSGYDLVEMKAQAAQLEKENELLRLEIAKMKSPQRIQEIATKNLGMVVPQNAYYASAAPDQAVRQAAGQAEPGTGLQISKAEASKRR